MNTSADLSTCISAVVLTCNRPDRCLDSVWHNALAMQGLGAEIVVVNNGTMPVEIPPVIAGVPCRVIQMPYNVGTEARNIGMRHARGEFLLFLDDDAYMDPGLIEQMLTCFRERPHTGAVSFRIENQTAEEGCLLPTVFHGCACGFRRSALEEVGGYPRDYLYYGEEYDVAFRLYNAGYRISLCDTRRRVRHMRDPGGRNADNILRLLVRNNTRLLCTFFPLRQVMPALRDVLQRYQLIARKEQAMAGYRSGLMAIPRAMLGGFLRRSALSSSVFNAVMMTDRFEASCRAVAAQKPDRVIVCGVGKFPSLWLDVARRCSLPVVTFWDSNTCWRDQRVQGVPVVVPDDPLPAVPPNTWFITGACALPESDTWRRRLTEELGAGSVAPDAEFYSRSRGSIDLIERCSVSVMTNKYGPDPRNDGRGMPLAYTPRAMS